MQTSTSFAEVQFVWSHVVQPQLNDASEVKRRHGSGTVRTWAPMRGARQGQYTTLRVRPSLCSIASESLQALSAPTFHHVVSTILIIGCKGQFTCQPEDLTNTDGVIRGTQDNLFLLGSPIPLMPWWLPEAWQKVCPCWLPGVSMRAWPINE